MNCHFIVGQRVVCIDADNTDLLDKGGVYTINYVGCWPARSGLDGAVVLYGVGLVEAEASGLGFDARRFRPVVERKTDISIFKAMLNPSKEQVSA